MRAKSSKEIDFKYNFGVYWGFLKKYKLILFLVVFFILIKEARSVLEKFLFKIIIDKGTLFSAGTLSREAFISILLIIAGVFIATTIIGSVNSWLRLHFLNRLENNIITDLKRKFFNHILGLDHNFHTTHKTGSMISRVGRGAGAMERMTDIITFNFVSLIFQLAIVSFSLIYLDITSALIISFTVVIFISYSFIIQRMQEKSNIEANRSDDIEKGNVADIFTNIDSIKYYGKENVIQDKYVKLSDKTRYFHLKNWDYFRWMSLGQNIILSIGTFFLLYFSLNGFLNGNISMGTLTFIYVTYTGLVIYVFGFVHGLRGFYRSMADFQDLFYYGKLSNDIKDIKGAQNLKIKEGTLEFKNVDFSYGKRKLLENFNLKIKANEKVAFVGHSGCGKTTLVKLLNRFYDVKSGQILIDGKDIRDFKQKSVRGETGIVPQECVLFDDTIFNNIKFSNPNANRKEVIDAIKFAQLDEIINNFPDKEKTIVGERGVKLSGGEKQRVSIARAILANKKILLLDEATSALDSETEHEIQRDLQKLLQGRTSIIIAHRLSTIMNADRIVVLKKGKIIQMGKHKNLIKTQGEYRKLWNLQKGGYIK
ncbi:ABC transporter ATP-binding protein [archaeon]|jgi:ATP-binding cassette, subfamily B, heavy metal transporter|nr:ABC transporter ATP-binding protein [archaeon]MBT4241303.1 ABC transporter ATP-binding protein [archaeon]MBT4418125.1 ABC transporter ATP-binding protein [archaeon]